MFYIIPNTTKPILEHPLFLSLSPLELSTLNPRLVTIKSSHIFYFPSSEFNAIIANACANFTQSKASLTLSRLKGKINEDLDGIHTFPQVPT